MKNNLLTLFLFLLSFSTYSSNAKFYSINSLYGISMREVASVCKDKNGFIWASSKTGVLRIAGDDYRIYQLPYENADIFSVKLVYSNCGLIAYTNNGQLFRYNAINDRFDLIVSMPKVLNNRFLSVSSLEVDNKGRYWVASTFGLYRYQKGHLTLVENTDETYFTTKYDVNQLFFAKSAGIGLLNMHSMKRKWLFRDNAQSGLHVSKFFYDGKAKRLWIGTYSKGLFFYDLGTHTLSRVQVATFPKQPILAIEANSDSSILVGIDGQGVWELKRTGNKVLNVYKEDVDDPSSLRGNGVYDIFSDQNKRVWICTYSGGVSFFDQTSPLVEQLTHRINNSNSLGNNNVNKIIQDKRGNIWMATDNGISRREAGTGRWQTFYQNKQEQARVFLSLCEDDKGRIWAGTYSSGIYVFDEQTGREIAHYSEDTPGSFLESNFVLDIFKDSQGDLWIGGIRGKMIRYLSKENKFRTYTQQPINAFSELSSSQLLLACSYGLCLLDKKSGEVKTLLDGYMVQDVMTLNNDVWICTSGDGLIRFNLKTHKTQKITTELGLPSNYVNSIMSAGGYLWLGTERGLCRLNPNNMGVLTYNSVFSLSRVSYNRNSHCRLRDGQLVWGTSLGAVRFSPEALTGIKSQGTIFFQDLSLAGRSIRGRLGTPLDSLQDLSLKYNQNTLDLELLSIGNILGAKYSWKLEGLDNEWSQPSGNRFINYSNIPSGDYLLKIKLYDSSLSKVIAERTLNLTIVPPLWKTWWFRLFLFLLTAGIIYFILNYYIERIKQQHTEEKVRFFTNTAHDIRTSLTLIKAPIEELTKEPNLSNIGRHYLSLATEQARRLSTVVTQLMDFQKVDIGKEQLSLNLVDIVGWVEHRRLMFESFAKSKRIDLQFVSDQECYQSAIDESMMDKVIDNLISNAIKYSHPDSQVQISLKCNPDAWTLEVQDHGIGISKKAQRQLFREFYRGENAINSKIVGSGIGLLLVKNYVALHGGDISCESQENVGSTFKLVIPFKEVVEDEASAKGVISESVPYVIPEKEPQIQMQQEELTKRDMRILIVEDNDDLRNFMRYPLQAEFEVLLAEDGVEAWDMIQKEMPDLVVSDVMMPNMDGFELCRLMKSTYETSHIPLIMLTALSGKAEQLHGLGLGADDYLTKPFDMTLLVQRIKSIIRNRAAVQDKALKLIKVPTNNNEQILTNELNDKFLKKMSEVVRANISNTEFGKDDFAAAMNVSSSLLYKKVKALTDQSPTDFIKLVRLDYALELLQTRKYSVTEVSELCGFSTIGYFSTVFKKHFGKSPTEM